MRKWYFKFKGQIPRDPRIPGLQVYNVFSIHPSQLVLMIGSCLPQSNLHHHPPPFSISIPNIHNPPLLLLPLQSRSLWEYSQHLPLLSILTQYSKSPHSSSPPGPTPRPIYPFYSSPLSISQMFKMFIKVFKKVWFVQPKSLASDKKRAFLSWWQKFIIVKILYPCIPSPSTLKIYSFPSSLNISMSPPPLTPPLSPKPQNHLISLLRNHFT